MPKEFTLNFLSNGTKFTYVLRLLNIFGNYQFPFCLGTSIERTCLPQPEAALFRFELSRAADRSLRLDCTQNRFINIVHNFSQVIYYAHLWLPIDRKFLPKFLRATFQSWYILVWISWRHRFIDLGAGPQLKAWYELKYSLRNCPSFSSRILWY